MNLSHYGGFTIYDWLFCCWLFLQVGRVSESFWFDGPPWQAGHGSYTVSSQVLRKFARDWLCKPAESESSPEAITVWEGRKSSMYSGFWTSSCNTAKECRLQPGSLCNRWTVWGDQDYWKALFTKYTIQESARLDIRNRKWKTKCKCETNKKNRDHLEEDTTVEANFKSVCRTKVYLWSLWYWQK